MRLILCTLCDYTMNKRKVYHIYTKTIIAQSKKGGQKMPRKKADTEPTTTAVKKMSKVKTKPENDQLDTEETAEAVETAETEAENGEEVTEMDSGDAAESVEENDSDTDSENPTDDETENSTETESSEDELGENATESDSADPENTETTADNSEIEAASENEEPDNKPKKRGRPPKKNKDAKDELTITDDTFSKRRVHRATKEERKEIYDEEDVFADFGDVAETEAKKRQEEYSMFRDAARSIPKTILKGEIGSVYETPNGMLVATIDNSHRLGKANENAVAEGYFQVIIPVDQMFPYDEKQYRTDEGRDQLKRKMSKRIGSEIHFCVYDVREKEGLVIGSRLTAQALRVNRWYIKNGPEGIPDLIPGMLAQATVIEVHNSYINIDLGGAEGKISYADLSYNHLGSLYDEYVVGEQLIVKIKAVNIFDYDAGGQKYRLATIDASAKEATLSPADKYFHQFHVGQICSGVIKAEANETGIFVNLQGKMDCLCHIPASGRAVANAKCGVRITVMDEKNKRIFGEIVSI